MDPWENRADDEFSRGLWLIDKDADGYSDLLVYSHGDDAMFLLPGSSEGITSVGARKNGPDQSSVKGWVRDACYWTCNIAWTIAPPGPVCDCSGCEVFSRAPPKPCPKCELV